MKNIEAYVSEIIENVRTNGDLAIAHYAKKFDKIKLAEFEVKKDEIRKSYELLHKDAIKALKFAKRNIEQFAGMQLRSFKNFEMRKKGIIIGQIIKPIEKVGVYVPGGNYPLPSTALMCAATAKIAGVNNIIVCSPNIKPETIVAADLAGADRIFRIGGAHAIAAMAYGTKTIPKADKIVGPGNVYVTAAKKMVYGDVGTDFLAGPSEIMIIADETAESSLVAADILAQLEHDAGSKAFFLCSCGKTIEEVKGEMKSQIQSLSTKKIIEQSIKNLEIIFFEKISDAIKIANEAAPEHLEIISKNSGEYFRRLRNYGSLFIGKNSPVAFGDYCSGTNHVLPTGKGAKFSGGLSVRDFIKVQTYQKIDSYGLKELAPFALTLSKMEGLEAHKKSVEMRIGKK